LPIPVASEPASSVSNLTLCLLHGVAHVSSCYQNWTHYLARRGYRCLALSYRGHGASIWSQPIQQARLNDYVADVETVLAAEGLDARQVILVGHSLGGGVALRLAARREVAGVISVASMAFGVWMQALWREFPFQLVRHPLVYPKLLHDPSALFQTPGPAREYLFGRDAPDDLVQWYLRACRCRESGKALLDLMQAKPEPLRTRHCAFIAGRQDASVSLRWVRKSAAQLRVPLTEVEGPHDLMLAGDWRGAAEAVWAFAQQIGAEVQQP
jgi:pimeloyl-ACP methyl ester carboxylesterase